MKNPKLYDLLETHLFGVDKLQRYKCNSFKYKIGQPPQDDVSGQNTVGIENSASIIQDNEIGSLYQSLWPLSTTGVSQKLSTELQNFLSLDQPESKADRIIMREIPGILDMKDLPHPQ